MRAPLPMLMILIGAITLFTAFGCGDDDEEITITSVLEQSTNTPPTIVDQGPDFEGQTFQAIKLRYGYGPSGPKLWVLVGDADGVDDISSVVISVDSVLVHSTIVRPDTVTNPSHCATLDYADPDTLDLNETIATVYPGVVSVPMEQIQGGRFETVWNYGEGGDFFGYRGAVRPDFTSYFETLQSTSRCTNGTYLEVFAIVPPLSDPGMIGFLTRADVEYRGIAVTAYDAIGESATATFADLRIVYITEFEITPEL